MALNYITDFSGVRSLPTPLTSHDGRLDGAEFVSYASSSDWRMGGELDAAAAPYLVLPQKWSFPTINQAHGSNFSLPLNCLSQTVGGYLSGAPGMGFDMRAVFSPSKKIVFGVCAHYMFTQTFSEWSGSPARSNAQLQFVFQACANQSSFSNAKTHFTVTLSWSGFDRFASGQSLVASFITGGSDKPSIPSQTIYYDCNQPLWIWVECDMISHSPGSNAPVGNARIWLNNDLVCSRLGILTADTSAWSSTLWHQHLTTCAVNGVFHGYESSKTRRFYGVAILDEKLSYMDSALGDIAIVSLPMSSAPQDQFTPHHSGSDLQNVSNATLINDHRLLQQAPELKTRMHLRGTEHLARDLFELENPLRPDDHIFAVQQSIAHRKVGIAGDNSKYRIEPTTGYSGRPVTMHRALGQRSISQAITTSLSLKILSAPYTIPYPGAFWTEEILRNAKFGYTCYDPANPALVTTEASLLGEYDVENVSDEISLSHEVTNSLEE